MTDKTKYIMLTASLKQSAQTALARGNQCCAIDTIRILSAFELCKTGICPMPGPEGVIQFYLDFNLAPPPPAAELCELNAWRWIFRRLDLLGQDPDRYDGYGFGNLSRRISLADGRDHAFIISGSQTGGLPELHPEHYVTVLDCDPIRNRVTAAGPIKPSSESLTHGLLYQADPKITWIMHLHSPAIYIQQDNLALPVTAASALCGTPQIAMEVGRIHAGLPASDPCLLVMGGHTDGILAFGTDPTRTGGLVVETLARALQLQRT